MKRFRVVVYDRIVRHLEKDFEADSEEEARELAEADEGHGWHERYEEQFSENYIERVFEVDSEDEEVEV